MSYQDPQASCPALPEDPLKWQLENITARGEEIYNEMKWVIRNAIEGGEGHCEYLASDKTTCHYLRDKLRADLSDNYTVSSVVHCTCSLPGPALGNCDCTPTIHVTWKK